MTPRYTLEWDLIVTAGNPVDYAAAVAKLAADAALRLSLLGEQWQIEEVPESLTVTAKLIVAADNLDDAA